MESHWIASYLTRNRHLQPTPITFVVSPTDRRWTLSGQPTRRYPLQITVYVEAEIHPQFSSNDGRLMAYIIEVPRSLTSTSAVTFAEEIMGPPDADEYIFDFGKLSWLGSIIGN